MSGNIIQTEEDFAQKNFKNSLYPSKFLKNAIRPLKTFKNIN